MCVRRLTIRGVQLKNVRKTPLGLMYYCVIDTVIGVIIGLNHTSYWATASLVISWVIINLIGYFGLANIQSKMR